MKTLKFRAIIITGMVLLFCQLAHAQTWRAPVFRAPRFSNPSSHFRNPTYTRPTYRATPYQEIRMTPVRFTTPRYHNDAWRQEQTFRVESYRNPNFTMNAEARPATTSARRAPIRLGVPVSVKAHKSRDGFGKAINLLKYQ